MVNEDGKIEIGVGVNTEELDKYSKKLDQILKQMQQVNGTTVKSTSSVNNLDDKFKKLTESSKKIASGNSSIGFSLSSLLNKNPIYSKLSGSFQSISGSFQNTKTLFRDIGSCAIKKEGVVSSRKNGNRKTQEKSELLSKSFEKLKTKANVMQDRMGAIAEKGGVVGKAAGGLSKSFSKLGPLIAKIVGILGRAAPILGGVGILLGALVGVIAGAVIGIVGLVKATQIATTKMKEFASQGDALVKERMSYDPTTATEAGAYRQSLIRQTGKLADKLGRLSTTLANRDVITFGGTLDVMKRRYRNVDDALDRHAITTMRVTALMDTLCIYIDTLKMSALDLIEPIVSNTKFLKDLATAIDVVITPVMWLGKGLAIFAGVIGDALSAIGSLVYGMINFVSDIPILGDFVKDALKVLDAKSSHLARDFVDDMENVFKKYEAGYYKNPYKRNSGLYNLSFMDYNAERSPVDNDVPTSNKDKEITDVTNNSLKNLFNTNSLKIIKLFLDYSTLLFGNILERLASIFSLLKDNEKTIRYLWDKLFSKAQGIVTRAKTFFEGIVTGIKTHIDGIVTGIKTHTEGIVTGIKTHIEGIVTGIKKHIDGIVTGIKAHIEGIVTGIITHIEGIVTGIKTHIDGIVTGIKTHIDGIVTGIKTHIDGIVTGIKTFFEGIVTGIKKHIDGIVTGITTFFRPLLTNVANICNLINSVISAIQNIANNIPFIGSSSKSSSSSSSKNNKKPLPEPTLSPTTEGTIVIKRTSNGAKALMEEYERSKSKGKLTGYSGSSNSQASNKTTPPKAYLKNSMSFAQVPYSNNNAFALPETQASASARNSNKSLELPNSHRLPYTDRSKELKILDPRNVDIKININTEKADKDFVEKMTEKLKKAFLDGLLYDY